MKLMKVICMSIFLSILATTSNVGLSKTVGSVSLEQQISIEKLISLYGYYYDNAEIDKWTSLFTEDARVEHYYYGEDKYAGLTSSNDSRRVNVAIHRKGLTDSGIQTRHFQTNTLLTAISDNMISGVTNFFVLHQSKKKEFPVVKHSGFYKDVFINVEGEWKFLKREVRFDHAQS